MPDPDPNDPQNGGGGGGRRGPDPTRVDDWTSDDWQLWYDQQPKGVQTMLDRQSTAATNFEAIRTRFGDGYNIIDDAMRDEAELKRLQRLKDKKVRDFVLDKGVKTYDDTFGSRDDRGGEGGGSRTEPSAVEKKLDDLAGRLTKREVDEAKEKYVAARNAEFLALAREVPDLFMQHDEAADPDAKDKNELARKRADRLINLAEHRSRAQFGENYFLEGRRVALKDVLDDIMVFADRTGEPPPAAVRTSRAGAADQRREPEPALDPSTQRSQMLANMKKAGGFARAARTGRG